MFELLIWKIFGIYDLENICNDSCCLNTDWCESYKEYFIESNVPNDKCEEYSNPLFRFKQ